MASPNHTRVAVQPGYPPAGQYPATYNAAPVAIGQPQQHPASPHKKFNSHYSRVSSKLFGFLQIVLCIASITGAIFVVVGGEDEYGTGFWCGTIYAAAGCLAAAAGWHTSRSMIIAVAVFSFLDIPFGITAMVLATNGLTNSGECDDEKCIIVDVGAMTGHAMVWGTGFWEAVFGFCLLVISIRAICLGSKPQVSSYPVYYSSSAPDTVQLNQTTSLHAHAIHPPTINNDVQRTHDNTTEANQYEAFDEQRF